MTEPDWMPAYEIHLMEGGFKNRLLEVVRAEAEMEVDAIAEAKALLEEAWKPGLRKGKRARPLIALVKRVTGDRSEEVSRLTWTLNGIVRS